MHQESGNSRIAPAVDAFGRDLITVVGEYMDEAREILESEERMMPRFFFELEEDLIPVQPAVSDADLRARSLEVARIYARAFWPLRISLLMETWRRWQDGSFAEFVLLRMETPNCAQEAYQEIVRDHAGRYAGLGEVMISESSSPAHDMTGFYPEHVPSPADQAAARAWLAPTYDRLEIERVARTPRPYTA